ncbi:hypothetical protein MJO29_005396 [Puccinia striiformis f. sp. tritici]|nr:hypothetical protein MJO29_005396 [Puccinia striiformis f. sp. tritici]
MGGSHKLCSSSSRPFPNLRTNPTWLFLPSRVQPCTDCLVVLSSSALTQLDPRRPPMSEALPEDPSFAQVQSNIGLAESLALRSGRDVSSTAMSTQRQNEIIESLRNRLKSLNKTVQLGLLDRWIKICRRSSTTYPPLPITGIKACLFINKVATEPTDQSIKEKLAVVIENWRVILEQEIGATYAGSQPIWTSKALCQLTGRVQPPTDPSIANSGKRKRSQENLSGTSDKSSSPLPQRCRTSLSRIPDSVVSQASPRHSSSNTPIDQKNIAKEHPIRPNMAEPLIPSSAKTPTNHTQKLVKSTSETPTTHAQQLVKTTSATFTNHAPQLVKSASDGADPASSEPNKSNSLGAPTSHKPNLDKPSTDGPIRVVEIPQLKTLTSAATSQAAISRPFPSPSIVRPIASQQAQVIAPLCNTTASQAVNSNSGLQESSAKSQHPTPSQGQVSRTSQNVNQQIATPTPAAHSMITIERNNVTFAAPVQNDPSLNLATSAPPNKWQHSFRRLDSALSELLETLPLIPVVPLGRTSFYKPNPYSPSFQWTAPRLTSYVDPPGLSLTNIFPIVTFRPQQEIHSPPAKPSSPLTPVPLRTSNPAPSGTDSEKKLTVVSSISPAANDVATHNKLPTPASPALLSLPPARPRPAIEPAPPSPAPCSNQDSNIHPSLHQSNQLLENVSAESSPIFNVTHAQKMKFVDTYRRVDASGKAKLEATLRKNKLWDILAPLLTPAALETSNTSTPQNAPPARLPDVAASSTPLNPMIVHPSASSTPGPSGISQKSSPNTAIRGTHVPAAISPKDLVTRPPNAESSKPATPQAFKSSFDPTYINSATSFKEGSLDPVLTKMISAMLGAEPQATNVLMSAFETLGIRNHDAIMVHLKALAVAIPKGNDTFWQLRTQALLSLPTPVLAQTSPIATIASPTPKPITKMSTPEPQTERVPSQPDHSVVNGPTAESVPMTVGRPAHLSANLVSPSPRAQIEPPKLQKQAQSPDVHALEGRNGDKSTDSTTKTEALKTQAGDETEVFMDAGDVSIVGDAESKELASVSVSGGKIQASIGLRGDNSINGRPSYLRQSPQKVHTLSVQRRPSRGPSPLGLTSTITSDVENHLRFNIIDDGQPGFPDVDPTFQIPGTPARLLARFPADQQMPPIRTFVPLLKKS